MEIDPDLVDAHVQLFPGHSVSAAVELVLKLMNQMEPHSFEIQKSRRSDDEKILESYDGYSYKEIEFELHFGNRSPEEIPIHSVLARIQTELNENRPVILMLSVEGTERACVIYRAKPDEIRAVTNIKNKYTGETDETRYLQDVRERIINSGGRPLLCARKN